MRNNQANLGCWMFTKHLTWSPKNPYQEKKRSTKTVIDLKRIQMQSMNHDWIIAFKQLGVTGEI